MKPIHTHHTIRLLICCITLSIVTISIRGDQTEPLDESDHHTMKFLTVMRDDINVNGVFINALPHPNSLTPQQAVKLFNSQPSGKNYSVASIPKGSSLNELSQSIVQFRNSLSPETRERTTFTLISRNDAKSATRASASEIILVTMPKTASARPALALSRDIRVLDDGTPMNMNLLIGTGILTKDALSAFINQGYRVATTNQTVAFNRALREHGETDIGSRIEHASIVIGRPLDRIVLVKSVVEGFVTSEPSQQ